MVVCGHLCTAFVPWLHQPAQDPKTPPHLFQLPFFRLAVGGRSAVALFFLVTGYVNSIGPIGKSRAGNHDAAFNGIARSALARSGRLLLPTMAATFVTWFMANTNAYHMTKHVDAQWIRQGWHRQEPTLWMAFKSLARAETETWTIGWDEYDGTQWTLHLFLEGAFLVYTTMLATILVKPKARFLVYAVLYVYFWQVGTGTLNIRNYRQMCAIANGSRTHGRVHQRPKHRHWHVRSRVAQPLQGCRYLGPTRPHTRHVDNLWHVHGRLSPRLGAECAMVAHDGDNNAQPNGRKDRRTAILGPSWSRNRPPRNLFLEKRTKSTYFACLQLPRPRQFPGVLAAQHVHQVCAYLDDLPTFRNEPSEEREGRATGSPTRIDDAYFYRDCDILLRPLPVRGAVGKAH
jgi:hypothetical protein